MNMADRMKAREALLEQYERSIGLLDNTPPGNENELKDYLSMTRNQVESLDASTAIGISVRLSQFAFYFQRAINRERANKIWAENELNLIVAKESLQYDKFTPNKAHLICSDNTAAAELNKICVYANQRIQRLEEISSGLKSLGYVLGLLFKSKTGDHR